MKSKKNKLITMSFLIMEQAYQMIKMRIKIINIKILKKDFMLN